jgi:hypothetical protein
MVRPYLGLSFPPLETVPANPLRFICRLARVLEHVRGHVLEYVLEYVLDQVFEQVFESSSLHRYFTLI